MSHLLSRGLLSLAGFVAWFSAAPVFGQGNVFNPYGNSGYADYREFAKPSYYNDPSLPGQARLQFGEVPGRNRANQFDSYVNSLDNYGDEFNSKRGVPSGLPYYQAQRYAGRDRQSSGAEQQYQEQVRQRNEAYFKALEERDPRKRALKLQQIERQDVVARSTNRNQRPADRSVAPNRNRPLSQPASRTAAQPQPGLTTDSPEAVPPINPASVPIPAPN